MVVVASYASGAYVKTLKLHDYSAKKWGADKVFSYGPEDVDVEFKEKNKEILNCSKGAGYWIWKPYIIKKALNELEEGDILIYTDAASAFVRPISLLIDAMKKEKEDVMCFCIDQKERCWTKRDAFILLDADKAEIADSLQICATYIIVKKTRKTIALIDDYLKYVQDSRIVTDEPNVMGKDNYADFIENRYDQTVWSLLCKKRGIRPFRDPSEYGLDFSKYEVEVLDRSIYPQVIESHRSPWVKYQFQLNYNQKWYHKLLKNGYRMSNVFLTHLGEIKRKMFRSRIN